MAKDNYFEIRRRRVFQLDSNDEYIEKGDLVSMFTLDRQALTRTAKKLHGLVLGSGKLSNFLNYRWHYVQVIWDNGTIRDVPADCLTIMERHQGKRVKRSIPPLKKPQTKSTPKSKATAKLVKRRGGRKQL